MEPGKSPKKLTREQWDELYAQFSVTPNPDEDFTETGEHWKLMALLNRLGYSPFSRKEAVRLAQRLLDDDYDEIRRTDQDCSGSDAL